MKKKISFIIILLAASYAQNILHAQIIHLGFKSEPFILFSNIGGEVESRFFTTSLYFSGGVKLNSHMQFDAQYGVLLSEGNRYNGFESSLMGIYYLREDKEHIICGYTLHKNGGDNSASHRTESKYISLGTIGVGTYLSKVFFVQALYQFPIGDNEYSYNLMWVFQEGVYKKTPLKIISLFKLGIGLSFDL